MTTSAEVIVVGGGVIGSAVTFELARRSVDVLLIDKTLPGRATSASAGGLWPVGEAVGMGCGIIHHQTHSKSDTLNDELLLPSVFRDFLAQSNSYFPELAAELKEFGGIDIEYEPGAGLMFLYFNEEEKQFVELIAESLPKENRPQILTATEAKEIEPQLTDKLLGAARLVDEHQVNPMWLAEGFKRAAIALGAKFRHETNVTNLCRTGNKIVGLQVGQDKLTCDTVVNAAGAWAGTLAETANLRLPIFPVRGQIVLTQSLPHVLNACLSNSGCYILQKKHGEVLIGSTTENAGFDVAVTPEAITHLSNAAVRTLPCLRDVGIKRVWSGLRPGTQDELPILGPMENVTGYINATGGFRTGVVASPLTGRVIAQTITSQVLDFPIETFLASRLKRAENTIKI
jgi:hydrogen cyanide synthase HcnC